METLGWKKGGNFHQSDTPADILVCLAHICFKAHICTTTSTLSKAVNAAIDPLVFMVDFKAWYFLTVIYSFSLLLSTVYPVIDYAACVRGCIFW